MAAPKRPTEAQVRKAITAFAPAPTQRRKPRPVDKPVRVIRPCRDEAGRR